VFYYPDQVVDLHDELSCYWTEVFNEFVRDVVITRGFVGSGLVNYSVQFLNRNGGSLSCSHDDV